MNKFINLMTILILACIFTCTCFAQDLKIGYVDIFTVFNEYEKTKLYDENLEKEKEKMEKKLEEKKKTIEGIQNKLDLLKDKEREREEEKLSNEIKEYREIERKAFTDIKKERDEKMKEIVDDIDKVIDNYAKENKFDLIVNENSVLYGNPSMDITDTILKKANQKYKKR